MGVAVGGEGVHEAHFYVLQVMPSDPVCLFGLLKDEEFTASSAATLGLPTVDGAYLGVWAWLCGSVWLYVWYCLSFLLLQTCPPCLLMQCPNLKT